LFFDDNSDFAYCKQWWTPCVAATLSFYLNLTPALSAGGLDSKAKVEDAVKTIEALMNAVIPTIAPQLHDLRQHTKLSK